MKKTIALVIWATTALPLAAVIAVNAYRQYTFLEEHIAPMAAQLKSAAKGNPAVEKLLTDKGPAVLLRQYRLEVAASGLAVLALVTLPWTVPRVVRQVRSWSEPSRSQQAQQNNSRARTALLATVAVVVIGAAWAATHWYVYTYRPEQYALRLLRDSLVDPESGRFRDVKVVTDGAVCGEINAKNKMGGYVGYRPFVVFRGKAYLPTGETDTDDEQEALSQWGKYCR